MAKRKISGLYWDKETGKGSIDKRVPGIGRVRHRFTAASWAEAESEYHRAIEDAKQTATAHTCQSFRNAAAKYLNDLTKKSAARDAIAIAKIAPHVGDLRLDQVHQGTLQPYIDQRRKDGIKSSTIARELAVVRRILMLAARVWRDENGKPWLPTAPLLTVPEWADTAKPYPLSWDEQHRFFQRLPKHLAEMALFGVNTGARSGVICGLRWEWEMKVPEIGRSVFLVPGMATKNGTDYLLVLNRTAQSIIDGRRNEGSEHVFTYRGRRLDRMCNSGWTRAWKAAGLPMGIDVLSGPHNLRHAFARRLRIAGVPLETRKVLLHHIDGDITIHYSPAELKELVDAVDRLDETRNVTMLRVVR